MRPATPSRWLSLAGLAVLVLLWHVAVRLAPGSLLPTPLAVVGALAELAKSGALFKHLTASLFRVTWGFLLALLAALPVGLWLGARRHAEEAFGPLLELLRPISPLAWTPLAILALGVGDLSAVAIIFVASFLPLVLAVKNGVHNILPTHLQAGRNFGLSPVALVRKVMLPAMLPQLLVGVRLGIGIAWIVVVAAEMLAVNSGLGFLIIDARNAGKRYDLVVAGMLLIGAIGLLLDSTFRMVETRFIRMD
jgi:NitT/TauT family transport system permease protein